MAVPSARDSNGAAKYLYAAPATVSEEGKEREKEREALHGRSGRICSAKKS